VQTAAVGGDTMALVLFCFFPRASVRWVAATQMGAGMGTEPLFSDPQRRFNGNDGVLPVAG
jgi:hypothetical protein